MSRLRYPVKFALIGAQFVLPLAVTMYFFQREVNSGIDFAINERVGVAYDAPVNALLWEVLQHEKQTERYALGDGVTDADLDASRQQIDATVHRIDAQANLATTLKSTEAWNKIKTGWSTLSRAAHSKGSRASVEACNSFAADVNSFITTVGNNSQLILDPDIDSYYMMDTAITQLPNLAINVAKARDLAADIAHRGAITADERTALTVLIGQISTPLGTIEGDMKQSVGYNAVVGPPVADSQRAVNDSVTAFLSLLDSHVIKPAAPTATAAQVFAAGDAALDTGLTYHRAASTVLDRLLAKRQSGFVARRTFVDGVAIAGLLLAVYLFIGFYRSTVYSVTALVKTARTIAAGDFDQTVEIATKDEIGHLAGDLQQMADSLHSIAHVAERVAEGDLTVTVTAHGERDSLSRAFGQMIDNLRSLVQLLQAGVDSVATTSAHLDQACMETNQAAESIAGTMQAVALAADQSSQASQELAQGSEQNAQAATDATRTVKELGTAIDTVNAGSTAQRNAAHDAQAGVQQAATGVQAVATSANQMADAAREAQATCLHGGSAVEQTRASMARIQQQVDATADHVRQLGARGQEIGAIVQIIEQIAEQTNLLALNAAIEAARAGENGRGFAVVADEVRKLASRSTDATREIGALVASVLAGVQGAITAMDSSHVEVTEGAALSARAGDALDQIQRAVGSVSESIDHVRTLASNVEASVGRVLDHMATVVEQSNDNDRATGAMTERARLVLHSIDGIAAVSEQSAAAAEEMSASAHEVAGSSQSVTAAVEEQVQGIAQVSGAATELREMADRLQQVVQRFTLEEPVDRSPRSRQDHGLKRAA